MRRWVKWTVAAALIGTVVLAFVLTLIHPETSVNVSLTVREISFRTNATRIFSPANEEQFIISRVAAVRIQGTGIKIKVGTDQFVENLVEIEGDLSASCNFYNVRSSIVNLNGDSILTLFWLEQPGGSSFGLRSHGSLNGSLTAQPIAEYKSGFSCARVRLNGRPVSTVEGEFSSEDTVYFASANDAQIDYRVISGSNIGDSQIPIVGDLRFSHITPGDSQEEKTVLLTPASGQSNEISFEEVNNTIKISDSDLLMIRPTQGFYLRQFKIDNGIQLSLHGLVKDVLVGAGPNDMKSKMPSLFDELDKKGRVFVVIPGIVALLLGILEKLGVLPRQ
jgi:hypothetical protein